MDRVDVVVVGAGPTGSTAAHVLARAGASVRVVDRERFPRFVIGESLLPGTLPVFERLGVSPANDPRHLRKSGAEFYWESKGEHAVYRFADSRAPGLDYAFQVERAAFDETLLDAAREAGAEVREGEAVRAVDLASDAVTVRTDAGTHRARYLLDASGPASLLARLRGTRQRIDAFGLASVFRHYTDLRPAIVDELHATGNVKVMFVEDGWLWAIPLGTGRLSVGLVTRQKDVGPALFESTVAASPELVRLLEGARPDNDHAIRKSFSFFNEEPQGPRFCAIGDAACFLDPMFSSGVTLGMQSGMTAGDLVARALHDGREGEPGLMDEHVAHMSHGYSVFATLILATYQRRLLPALFFAREQDPLLRKGLTAMLAGEVWMPNNPFQSMLERSKRRRFEIPAHRAAS